MTQIRDEVDLNNSGWIAPSKYQWADISTIGEINDFDFVFLLNDLQKRITQPISVEYLKENLNRTIEKGFTKFQVSQKILDIIIPGNIFIEKGIVQDKIYTTSDGMKFDDYQLDIANSHQKNINKAQDFIDRFNLSSSPDILSSMIILIEKGIICQI